MTELAIQDVKKVLEVRSEEHANKHLQAGWRLLLVRTGLGIEQNLETRAYETTPYTSYTLGWALDKEPPVIEQDQW